MVDGNTIRNFSASFLLLFISQTGLSQAGAIKLVVKPVNQFNEVYNDSGTGASDHLSIWRPDLSGPRFSDGVYFSLGDVAMGAHGVAPKTALAVTAVAADALAPPTGYIKVWDDSGSGGNQDVQFWQPLAPSGYTCIGHLAVANYWQTPDTNWIRCVKSDYLRSADYQKVWDDGGSGADDDASVWQAAPHSGDEAGLPVNTFIARMSHNVGSQQFYVLDAQYIEGMGFNQLPANNNDWINMAQQFAPLVYLHQDDPFLPSEVPFHTPPTSPFYGNNSDIADSAGFLETLLSCAVCTDQTFLFGKNPETHSVPVYASIIVKDSPATTTDGIEPTDTVTDIVYWMFYPYNRGKYVNPVFWDTDYYGNHVGDWEHSTVRFVNGRPYRVYLSQHGDGAVYPFADKNLMLTGSNAGEFGAQVYSAKGSHALYASVGSFTYKTIAGFIDLTDHTGQGKAWNTKSNVEVMFYQPQGQYNGSHSWMNYSGRWGNSEQSCIGSPVNVCKLEDGPTGPAYKPALQKNHFPLD